MEISLQIQFVTLLFFSLNMLEVSPCYYELAISVFGGIIYLIISSLYDI